MEQAGLFEDVIQENLKKNVDRPTNHVAFILDKSGSMVSMAKVAMDSFNEQLQTLKKESHGIDTFVSLITFNKDVDMEFFEKPLYDINVNELKKYETSGLTALYDAIGLTIDKFRKINDMNDADADSSTLFIIITDGYENASREFEGEEGRKKLKGIIEELESTNKWTFTFMGANINVMEVAHEGMSMSAGNTFSYVASNEGYRNMSEGINNSLKGYYDIRKKGETYTKDFFNLGTNSNGSDKKLDESTGNADSLKKEESTNGKKS